MNDLISSQFRPNIVKPARPAPGKSKSTAPERSEYAAPRRPSSFFIPTPEALEALIERGLKALARGIYWERGSIINILL